MNNLSSPVPIIWLRNNLFNTWYNSLLTLISIVFLFGIGSSFIQWALTEAKWTVIPANLRLFFVGRYPQDQIWRVWITLGLIVANGGFSWGLLTRLNRLFDRTSLMIIGILSMTCVAIAIPTKIYSSLFLLINLVLFIATAIVSKPLGKRFPKLVVFLPLIWFINFLIILLLLQGGLFLEVVRLDDLSGLILTILTALVSIVLSFPFGILLALGRQSNLPVIRWLSIAYIEIIRGLPLIGILFMAQIMLPLVLSPDVRPDRVIRAIIGYTIFSAAYLAENVRGGLQSIPKGQYEAAKALGLNTPLSLALIILPQALKAVIPSMVGQFISLFKDTSLLAIIGLVDLLGISQSILANPKYIGRYAEVYLFIALIYFICCYAMSLAARKLEKQLATE
ncbi:amino acid ABC transporter permease [Aphanothece hegewaldii CCALA 016]|uniref:Amino acid ABC transporter permease n=1 Tax=Aphanothece hegewaldii CCALA 016 TaxID=2107694 RepID=A0A2T1M2A0_9CHRO|nr:amino acid ABC transporter permease [Aphanothece hegewaldii]PSF38755.1 amino acid ABC transporter permease [Aphanothece hegewaldii CCALA 016]